MLEERCRKMDESMKEFLRITEETIPIFCKNDFYEWKVKFLDSEQKEINSISYYSYYQDRENFNSIYPKIKEYLKKLNNVKYFNVEMIYNNKNLGLYYSESL